MSLNERTQKLLETEVFKGKIVERRKGRGGLIYIVEREAYPNRVAYKTIQEFEDSISVDMLPIDRETRNWFIFSGHPLVVQPFYIKRWNSFPLICMPYCDGDLSEIISNGQSLTSAVCLSLQIVKGMMVANKRGMEHHQDIKPENILFVDLSTKFHNFPPSHVDPSLKYSIRIADFGTANAWNDNYLGGTNAYKAPEQHDPSPYDEFIPDVFAVGLVIAELFQGYHPAAKDRKTKVGKWRGSKLKKWANNGERNFSTSENPQAQKLVTLVKQMLNADPSDRPSFQECYDTLTCILKTLSFASLEQLELLFEYFDYIDNHYKLESEINKLLRLAVVPSQKDFVKQDIKGKLKNVLEGGSTSLKEIIRTHHLAKAFHKICSSESTQDDKALLIESSRKIMSFVLTSHELITSNHMWPPFSFASKEEKKLASNLEAKAELLNTSIKRLEVLNFCDHQLIQKINDGGNVIQSCVLMGRASANWRTGNYHEACELLKEVRELTPNEKELDDLYKRWIEVRDTIGNLVKESS